MQNSIQSSDVDGDNNNNILIGSAGSDRIYGMGGSDVITGLASSDTLYGGSGAVSSSDGADTIDGGDGTDLIYGNGGNDSIVSSDGSDTVYGGLNNDTINYSSNTDNLLLYGNAGNDTLTGGSNNDIIYGGDGASDPTDSADSINGGGGADIIYGNGGNDTITGSSGTDSVYGGGDNDSINYTGNSSNNVLYGNDGSDTIIGGSGNDTMYGGSTEVDSADSSDSITAGMGADLVFANGGDDTVRGTGTATASSTIYGGTGADNIDWSAVTGYGGKIYGNDSNDTIKGAAYNNTLDGGSGNDSITAGTGTVSDSITGGAGSDIILFASATDLASGDTVWGGDSSSDSASDTLKFNVNGVSLSATDISNTRGFEAITFLSDAGTNAVTLSNDFAASSSTGIVTISLGTTGGASALTVNGAAVTAARLNITGGGGADVFTAGGGNDTLDGGAGNDSFTFTTAHLDINDIITGGTGTDTLLLSDAGTVASTAFAHVSGIDALTLADGSNNITLTDALITSAAGSVLTVTGGTGADTIDASAASAGHAVNVSAGNGNNSLVGGAGNDTLNGGSGTDTMTGGKGADSIDLGASTQNVVIYTENNAASATTGDLAAGSANMDSISSFAVGTGTNSDIVRFSGSNLVASLIAGGGAAGAGGTIASMANATNFTNGAAGAIEYWDDGTDIYFRISTAANTAYTTTDDITIKLSGLTSGIAGSTLETSLSAAGDITISSLITYNVINGDGSDNSFTGTSGNDVYSGEGANDTFTFSIANLGNRDSIYGGNSTADSGTSDTLAFSDGGIINLGTIGATLSGIDILTLSDSSSNTLTVSNAVVSAANYNSTASLLRINAGSSGDNINGSAVTSGTLSIVGGSAVDTITGGSGNDTIIGAGGIDSLNGGNGNNIFVISATADINGLPESIIGGTGTDSLRLDVTGSVNLASAVLSSIEAIVVNNVGGNNITATEAQFEGFSSITGGAGTDQLTLSATGALDLSETTLSAIDSINGAGAADIITLGTSNALTINAANASTTVSSTSSSLITINAAAMVSAAETLRLQGSSDYTVSSLIADLSASTATGTINASLGDDTIDNAISVAIGTNSATVSGSGTSDIVTVTATELLADTTLTLSGSDAFIATLSDQALTVDASAATTTLDLTLGDADAGTIAINASHGSSTIRGGSYTNEVSIDATQTSEGNTITLSGDQAYTITSLKGCIDAGSVAGELNITTADATSNTSINITIGQDDATITGTGANDTIGVNPTHLADGKTLTLLGDSSFVVENLGSNDSKLDASALTTGGVVTLSGGDGDETLIGGSGADSINGGSGNDSLSGGGGNDILSATVANLDLHDTIAGGENTDTLLFTDSGTISGVFTNVTGIEAITLAAGTNSLTVTNALVGSATGTTLAISGGTANTIDASNVTTSSNKVSITGGTGGDSITGGSGADTINSGDGNDTISGGGGADSLNGGIGTDIFNSTIANFIALSTLVGGTGADTLVFSDNGDINFTTSDHITGIDAITLTGSGSSRTITLSSNLVSGAETNILTVDNSSSSGGDSITGAAYAGSTVGLSITGGSGNDTIIGGSGNDTINGGGGTDSLNGGNGADSFTISIANFSALSTLVGGTGADTLTFSNAGSIDFTASNNITGIDTVTLAAHSTDNYTITLSSTLAGGAEASNILTVNDSAASSGDTINGAAATASLNIIGGTGGDSITGGSGADSINSGDGNDTITGGNGTDTLIGGAGSDNFVYSVPQFANAAETIWGGIENHSASEEADNGEGGSDTDTITFTDNTGLSDIGSYLANTHSIEAISFFSDAGNNTITLTDAFVGNSTTGQVAISVRNTGIFSGTLSVNASAVAAEHSVSVTGGSSGNDTITGGSGNDTITGNGGNDTLNGGAGNDSFNTSIANLSANDTIAGSTGTDTLAFTSAGTISGVFTNVTGIEAITLAAGTNSLTVTDALVGSATGTSLAISGGTDNTIDTSNVTTAGYTVNITAGTGNNTVITSSNSDTITLGSTSSSSDVVRYGSATTSLTTNDTVNNFTLGNGAGYDRIDWTSDLVSSNGATITGGSLGSNNLTADNFNAARNLATDLVTGVTNASTAVVFYIGAGGFSADVYDTTTFGTAGNYLITNLITFAGQKALITVGLTTGTEVYYIHDDNNNGRISASELTPVALLAGTSFNNVTADNFV